MLNALPSSPATLSILPVASYILSGVNPNLLEPPDGVGIQDNVPDAFDSNT